MARIIRYYPAAKEFFDQRDRMFSAIALTCKYRNWRAAGDSEIISDASLRAPEAFFSPSAAMTCVKCDYWALGGLCVTLALASLAASASAAIALCSCSGSLASLLKLE